MAWWRGIWAVGRRRGQVCCEFFLCCTIRPSLYRHHIAALRLIATRHIRFVSCFIFPIFQCHFSSFFVLFVISRKNQWKRCMASLYTGGQTISQLNTMKPYILTVRIGISMFEWTILALSYIPIYRCVGKNYSFR